MTRSLAVVLALAAAGMSPVGPLRAQSLEITIKPPHQSLRPLTETEFFPIIFRHHLVGIELARIEEERGVSPDIRMLAARIRDTWERNMALLQSGGGEAANIVPVSAPQMDELALTAFRRLESASGQELDRVFLEEMIRHHEVAIRLAKGTRFRSNELRALARRIAKEQKDGLKALKQLRSR